MNSKVKTKLVVRCANCTHFRSGCPTRICGIEVGVADYCTYWNATVTFDDFCSNGVLKGDSRDVKDN